jgi:hypothetical protein
VEDEQERILGEVKAEKETVTNELKSQIVDLKKEFEIKDLELES